MVLKSKPTKSKINDKSESEKDGFIITIQIFDSTRNRLKNRCRKYQTYDQKIYELLDLES